VEHPASTAASLDHPGPVRRLAEIPRYRWIQITILAVLIVAFVTSFQSGSEGAHQSGYRAEFSMSFPLICDVVAMLATVVHGWARHDAKMRRLAALFVMGPMILSWAANAVDHLANAHVTTFGATYGEKAWTLWVILAAGLCPVAVAALLYFATKFIEFEQRSAVPELVETPEISDEIPETAPVAVAPRPEISAPDPAPEPSAVEVDDELVSAIDEIEIQQAMDEHRVTRDIAEIMVRDRVSRATAYRRRGSNASLA
jgi:hypothetical protein